jgi:hypothetical protein
MKSTEITIPTVQVDPAIESTIRKADAALKELAAKNAEHFAKRNLPAPVGDTLAHYTGELKSGYEKIAADVFQHLQPAAHFPEAKIDADFFREKDGSIDKEISEHEHQNQNDEYSLGNFNPGLITSRIRWAVIATLIITFGEIMFNTKALQVIGGSMILALILSISVSFAVFLFSHLVPFLYKAAKNKLQRWLVILISLFLITSLFTALAIFRTAYLASHDVYIKPIYFVVINLFFFVVSSLLSFFVLPTWQEIKQNAHKLKIHLAIGKRKKRIEQLKKEKEVIRQTISERTKHRIRVVHCANYSAERFRKMYQESIAIFKRTNLAYRTDRCTPDCFSQLTEEPDITDVSLNLNASNRKVQ